MICFVRDDLETRLEEIETYELQQREQRKVNLRVRFDPICFVELVGRGGR